MLHNIKSTHNTYGSRRWKEEDTKKKFMNQSTCYSFFSHLFLTSTAGVKMLLLVWEHEEEKNPYVEKFPMQTSSCSDYETFNMH